jgi:hypothetical protein
VQPGEEFAILTNLIHEEWSEVSVKEHKKIKGLERQNLRDHMTEAELIFTALAEMSTLEENASAAHVGGGIAKRARKELEGKTGQSVVSGESFLPPAKTIMGLTSE